MGFCFKFLSGSSPKKYAHLPSSPACTLQKCQGEVIYVGKAKNCVAGRLLFHEAVGGRETGTLVREAVDVDYLLSQQ